MTNNYYLILIFLRILLVRIQRLYIDFELRRIGSILSGSKTSTLRRIVEHERPDAAGLLGRLSSASTHRICSRFWIKWFCWRLKLIEFDFEFIEFVSGSKFVPCYELIEYVLGFQFQMKICLHRIWPGFQIKIILISQWDTYDIWYRWKYFRNNQFSSFKVVLSNNYHEEQSFFIILDIESQ